MPSSRPPRRPWTLFAPLLVAASLWACSNAGRRFTQPDTGIRRDAGDAGAAEEAGGNPGEDSGNTDQPGEDAEVLPTDDVQEIEGGGIYDDAGGGPGGDACSTGGCTPTAPGCTTAEACNDGLDNNCNGQVDENCACLPGAVQRCLVAPPGVAAGSALVGACSYGRQTCQGSGEFGIWGACEGGIAPRGEVCDGLDNNCNGCVDEGLCCAPVGTCPGPGDPRIPTGLPFRSYSIRGASFVATADRFTWHVEGGPCDQLLWTTSRKTTYTINGSRGVDAQGPNLIFAPTLSGDYTVTFTAYRGVEIALMCTFIVPIRAPGLRAELCWDTTGADDVDFWLHKPGTTSNWSGNDVCAYWNCRNTGLRSIGSWGYADSPIGPTTGSCREPDGSNCHSPRLDIDNISTVGEPENINVDPPVPGQTFRVAVNYFGGADHTVRPMVNLYCGGAPVATFGGADIGGRRYGAEPVNGFNTSGGNTSGSVWRVADVRMDTVNTCTVTAMHPRGTRAGYCVDTSTNRTYDGPCSL